jgi:hypothetical protein
MVTLVAFTLLTLWATSASAQYFASEDQPGFIVSTTTTTSAIVGGVIMLTVVSVKKEPTAMLRHYLRHNETAVRSGLALGAGDSLRDLAAIFGVVDERRFQAFAQMARRTRKQWLRLAYDTENVERLMRLVHTAMQLDPALRDDRTEA